MNISELDIVELIQISADEHIHTVSCLASEIWHEHFPGIISVAQVDYMVGKFQSEQAISDQIHTQGYTYYFLMDNHDLVGYVGIRGDSDRLFLSKLYVRKACRGKGYSRTVMHALEDLCVEHGYHSIWLTVNKNNAHTIRIYERLGFITTHSQEADIGSGYIMDDFVMEKEINHLGICDTKSATPSHSSS